MISLALHFDWLGIGDEHGEISFAQTLDEASRMAVFGVSAPLP